MSALLSVRDLAYGHPGRTLGRNVAFDMAAGEVLCVLGPNGSGKTTLFRTLLGLIPPQAGAITVGGIALAACTAAQRARQMAYVPQAGSSYFAFSVREIVLMGRTAHQGLLSAPHARDLEATAAALAELGLGHLADQSFSALSGGERQLVLVARALAQAAPLLVMDEPAASLDFGNQVLMLEEIRRLKAAGRAVIFCSHNPDHALQCADRVMLLHRGNVLALGSTGDIVNASNLRTLYGVDVELVAGSGGALFCHALPHANPGRAFG